MANPTWKPTKQMLGLIARRISEGATEDTIAKELGMHPTTLSLRKKEFPEVGDVISGARKDVETEVVGKLMRIIRDDDHKGNLTAIIFWLKCQARWKETATVAEMLPEAPKGFNWSLQKKETVAAEKADEPEAT